MITVKPTVDILVIGGESIIGSALLKSYFNEPVKVWSTTRKPEKTDDKCFLLDFENVFIEESLPDIFFKTVFICVGITKVQLCSEDPIRSSLINVHNTVAVAKYFAEKGSFVVYLSTGAVFDGNLPYSEPNELVNPQREYGRQKAEAENLLFPLSIKQLAIIRLSKVIQPDMPLFNNWIRDLKAEISISPFVDMVIAPVSLDLVVEGLTKIAAKQIPGMHQLSANKDISYYDCALYLADKLTINPQLILPISYKTRPNLWSPPNTTMNCSRLQEIEMISPSPFEAFDPLLKSYL